MDARTCGGALAAANLCFWVLLAAMLTASDALAQARGDVSVRPKGPAGLEALARRMAESPKLASICMLRRSLPMRDSIPTAKMER